MDSALTNYWRLEGKKEREKEILFPAGKKRLRSHLGIFRLKIKCKNNVRM